MQITSDSVEFSKPAPAVAGAPRAFAVQIENVVRRFGNVEALSHVHLDIQPGEFFSLLGPSGCGKTTLLRIIAGLDHPDEGSLKIAGADASNLPAHRRPVNTVFQSYALFPHLNVRDNVAFGLRMKKVPKPQIEHRVQRAMEMVEIAGLAGRKPSQISGGQKQRVALARALVNEPQVLLLDEPLGALDLKLRKQLQEELHRLQRRLGITFIYVTHDQEEALALSDRLAVMNAGQIEQVGKPQEIYERPRNRFVAQFLGSCNLLAATVKAGTHSTMTLETPIGVLQVAADFAPSRDQFTVTIRPEKIQLLPIGGAPTENCVPGKIISLVYRGAHTEWCLAIGNQVLKAVTTNAPAGQLLCSVGETVQVHLPPSALIVLDD